MTDETFGDTIRCAQIPLTDGVLIGKARLRIGSGHLTSEFAVFDPASGVGTFSPAISALPIEATELYFFESDRAFTVDAKPCPRHMDHFHLKAAS